MSHLQQAYQQAQSELQQSSAQRDRLNERIQALLPACETAARNAHAVVMRHARDHANAAVKQVMSRSTLTALSLKPIGRTRGSTIMLWLGLWVILPWLVAPFHPFFSWELSYLPFPLLVLLKSLLGGHLTFVGIAAVPLIPSALLHFAAFKLSRRRLAHKECKSILEFVDHLSTLSAHLMHVDSRGSGDSSHPYAATWAPNSDVLDTMRFDAGLGDMHDADLVCLCQPQNKLHIGLRLPVAGKAPALVTFGSFTQAQRQLLEQIAQSAAAELAALASGPIRALAEPAETMRPVLKQIELLARRLQTLRSVVMNWSDVAIAEPALDRILKLVDLFASGRKPAPKGVLLYGPPGTGKTLIARKLAKHAGCHFEAVTIGDLKGTHIGQTAPKVKELFARCRKHAPTLLFVDECESAFARRGSTDTDSFGAELVQTFLSEWDGFAENSGQVLVIGATNRRDILDDAIVSRFTACVEIGLPDAEARRRILRHEFSQARMEADVSDAIVKETSGMSGRDLHTLVAGLAAEELSGSISPDTLLAAIRKIRGKGSTQVQSLGWDDIVLPPRTREEFEGLGKELKNAEQLAKLGIAPPRGILLYGPPGTGKTQIARVLASQSGLGFVAATTADMKANYMGQSGNKVKAIFEKARAQAPCILFIDEIDIVAPARDGQGSGDSFTQEIIGQLLQELDGVASTQGQVFLLAASNHPERIDSALLSRMERKVEIGLPDLAGRESIIAMQLAGKPVDFDIAVAARSLAGRTEGSSGRDLQSLVTRATRSAVKRATLHGDDVSATLLQLEDLEQALGTAEAA